MKKILITLFSFILSVATFAQEHVKGYYKKNGTYVQPYVRSSPDGNPYNNYSYPGNTNPYTGKVATGNPDTYIYNYYNKSGNYQSKYYVNDYTTLQAGEYLKLKEAQTTYINYAIYDKTDSYNGLLTIYSDKTVRILDKNNVFIKEVDNFNSAISDYSPVQNSSTNNTSTTYINPYFPNVSNATPANKPSSKSVLKRYSKIYIKDEDGNYTDKYMIVDYIDETVTKYTIYNHSNVEIGSISEYSDGEKFYYNANGTLLKHITAKK